MKKVRTQVLVKFFVVSTILIGFGLSAKIIYDRMTQAMTINSSLVEFYSPHLDTNLVKKAANYLKKDH